MRALLSFVSVQDFLKPCVSHSIKLYSSLAMSQEESNGSISDQTLHFVVFGVICSYFFISFSHLLVSAGWGFHVFSPDHHLGLASGFCSTSHNTFYLWLYFGDLRPTVLFPTNRWKAFTNFSFSSFCAARFSIRNTMTLPTYPILFLPFWLFLGQILKKPDFLTAW